MVFVLQVLFAHRGPSSRSRTPALQEPGATQWERRTGPRARRALQDSTATALDSLRPQASVVQV